MAISSTLQDSNSHCSSCPYSRRCSWSRWYVCPPPPQIPSDLDRRAREARRKLTSNTLQDKLIISTAIPKITDTFNSPDDVGWYGTAYLLTNCAFQLVFGKVYKFFPVKTTFLASIVLFEAGSALCGAAPSSIAFIFGRAIAGLGAGGVLPGVVRPFPSPRIMTLQSGRLC